MVELYFLLFLLGSSGRGDPIGIFRSLEDCRVHGRQVSAVVERKFDCMAATEPALRYFQGKCLGRPEDCDFIGK